MPTVRDAIAQALKNGVSPDEISSRLTSFGLTQQDVDTDIEQAYQKGKDRLAQKSLEMFGFSGPTKEKEEAFRRRQQQLQQTEQLLRQQRRAVPIEKMTPMQRAVVTAPSPGEKGAETLLAAQAGADRKRLVNLGRQQVALTLAEAKKSIIERRRKIKLLENMAADAAKRGVDTTSYAEAIGSELNAIKQLETTFVEPPKTKDLAEQALGLAVRAPGLAQAAFLGGAATGLVKSLPTVSSELVEGSVFDVVPKKEKEKLPSKLMLEEGLRRRKSEESFGSDLASIGGMFFDIGKGFLGISKQGPVRSGVELGEGLLTAPIGLVKGYMQDPGTMLYAYPATTLFMMAPFARGLGKGLKSRAVARRMAETVVDESGVAPTPAHFGRVLNNVYQTVGEVLDPVPVPLENLSPARRAAYTQKLKTQHQANLRKTIETLEKEGKITSRVAKQALKELSAMDIRLSTEVPGGVPPEFLVETNAAKLGKALRGSFIGAALMGDFLTPLLGTGASTALGGTIGGPGLAGLKAFGPKIAGRFFPVAATKLGNLADLYTRELVDPTLVQPRIGAVLDEPVTMTEQAKATGTTIGAELRQRPEQPVSAPSEIAVPSKGYEISSAQGVVAEPAAMSQAFRLGGQAVEAARKADELKAARTVEQGRLDSEYARYVKGPQNIVEQQVVRPARPVYMDDVGGRAGFRKLVRKDMSESNFGDTFTPKTEGTQTPISFNQLAEKVPNLNSDVLQKAFAKHLHNHVETQLRKTTVRTEKRVPLTTADAKKVAKKIANELVRDIKEKQPEFKFKKNKAAEFRAAVLDMVNSQEFQGHMQLHTVRLLDAIDAKTARRQGVAKRKVSKAQRNIDKFSDEYVRDAGAAVVEVIDRALDFRDEYTRNTDAGITEVVNRHLDDGIKYTEPEFVAKHNAIKNALRDKLIAEGVSEGVAGAITNQLTQTLEKRVITEAKYLRAQRAREAVPRTAQEIATAAKLQTPGKRLVFEFTDPTMSRLVNDFAESVELLGIDKARVRQMFADAYTNESSVGLLLDERMRGALTKRLTQELIAEQGAGQFNKALLAEQLTRLGLDAESALNQAAQAIDLKLAPKILRKQIDTFVRETLLENYVSGEFTNYVINNKPISEIIRETYNDFASNPKAQSEFKAGAVEALRDNLLGKMSREGAQQAFAREAKRSLVRAGYDPTTQKSVAYRGVVKSLALEAVGEEPFAIVVDQALAETPNLFSSPEIVRTLTEQANAEIAAIWGDRPNVPTLSETQVQMRLAKLAGYEAPSQTLQKILRERGIQADFDTIKVDPNYNSAVSAHFESLNTLAQTGMFPSLYRHSKRALTTLSGKTILGNIYSNIYLQSLMYGQTPVRTQIGYAMSMRDLVKYKKGDLSPQDMAIMRAIEGSGVMDSSAISDIVKSMKGSPVDGKPAQIYRTVMGKAGGFYQLGDAVPKLYSTMRTMREMLSEFEQVEPGRDVVLMPKRGRNINMRKNADGSWTVFGKGPSKRISSTSQEYYNLIADTAARTARETLVDFNKTPTALKRLQSKASFLTPVSMFFTWAHQTMELPGKPGIFSGALNFEPLGHVKTNSPYLLRAQSKGLLKLSAKRASLSALARYYDTKNEDAESRVHRIMSGYSSQGVPLVRSRTGEDTFGVSNPINANPFSTLATMARFGRGTFYQLFGREAARKASAKAPEERSDYDKRMLRLEQSRLAGQLNPIKDAAMLAGLAHPTFANVVKQLDKGTEDGAIAVMETAVNFLAGTTVGGATRFAYDAAMGNVLRRAKVVQERGEKIDGRFENIADYMIYHIFKEGLRETNIAKEGKEWIERQRNRYHFPYAGNLKRLQQVGPAGRNPEQNERLLSLGEDKIEFMRHRLAMFGGKKSSFRFPLDKEYMFLRKTKNRTPEQEAYYQRVLEMRERWVETGKNLFRGKKKDVKGLFQEDLDAYMQRLKGSPRLKKPVFSRQ